MKPGDTFILPDAFGKHLNVVVAVTKDGSVVLCHFTTRTRRSDPTCVIQPGEHSFVVRETTVRYDQALICESGPAMEALVI